MVDRVLRKRSVFFISDGTGITAENIGHTLMSQFQDIDYRERTLPFVNTPEKAAQAARIIQQAGLDDGIRPIIFSTLIDDSLRAVVAATGALDLDLFNVFIRPLEQEFETASALASGRVHAMANKEEYRVRIDAVNFALQHDDGATSRRYGDADVILVGVSRTGKTPTCLYLAMQFGVRAANYPITEDDADLTRLPGPLRGHESRLYGLTIEADELAQIRAERRPGSHYASFAQCRREVLDVEALFRRKRVAFVNTTAVSVEEIATRIIHAQGLSRRSY